MKPTLVAAALIALAIGAGSSLAQEAPPPEGDTTLPGTEVTPPRPPTNLVARDHPWDHGERIDLTWTRSPDDPAGVQWYRVYRADSAAGPFVQVSAVPAGEQTATVEKLVRDSMYDPQYESYV